MTLEQAIEVALTEIDINNSMKDQFNANATDRINEALKLLVSVGCKQLKAERKE